MTGKASLQQSAQRRRAALSCQHHFSPGRCLLVPRVVPITSCWTLFFSCLIPSCSSSPPREQSAGAHSHAAALGFSFALKGQDRGTKRICQDNEELGKRQVLAQYAGRRSAKPDRLFSVQHPQVEEQTCSREQAAHWH